MAVKWRERKQGGGRRKRVKRGSRMAERDRQREHEGGREMARARQGKGLTGKR